MPSAFQQTAWPYRKRSLVTAMCILPAKEISVDFASPSDEGQILRQNAAGTNDPRTAKRKRDDAPASPTTPVAKDADQAAHVANACSLGASQPPCTTETRTGHIVSQSVWAPHLLRVVRLKQHLFRSRATLKTQMKKCQSPLTS